MSQSIECVDYPFHWRDSWGDGCDQYTSTNICNDAFTDASKRDLILNNAEVSSGVNAFQACCDCADGSLYNYKNEYLIESLWKPQYFTNINDSMMCDTYNPASIISVPYKWSVNALFSICQYFTARIHTKYQMIYNFTSDLHDCMERNIFISTDTDTYYICEQFDYNIYLYLIDLSSSSNHVTYINSRFTNTNRTHLQDNNTRIIYKTQCNIAPLLYGTSNVITSFVCDSDLTHDPTTIPTVDPTTATPTIEASVSCRTDTYPTVHGSSTHQTMEHCHDFAIDRASWYLHDTGYTSYLSYSYNSDSSSLYTSTHHIFFVNIIVTSGDCLNPVLSIRHRARQAFTVHSDTGASLATCDDYAGTCCVCSTQYDCLTDQPITDILQGHVYSLEISANHNSWHTCGTNTNIKEVIYARLHVTCDTPTLPTVEPTQSPTTLDLFPIQWYNVDNYTCNSVASAARLLYNVSVSQCTEISESMYSTSAFVIWYEWINAMNPGSPRCYVFNNSCTLIREITKPVVASFPFVDMKNAMQCVDYPMRWEDSYLDNCDAYDTYHWCVSGHESVATVLSYSDSIDGFNAIDTCCSCNGGLYSYVDRYLFEIIWKRTSEPEIDVDDFVCETLDFSPALYTATTADIDRNSPLLNVQQFAGVCDYLYSAIMDKWQWMIDVDNTTADYQLFVTFRCLKAIYLRQFTVCDSTDYNNLYPFIVDVEQNHMYINSHYINKASFVGDLGPVSSQSYCNLSSVLNKTNIVASVMCEMVPLPTSEPTDEPTQFPTNIPTAIPSNIPTTHPSMIPTKVPTKTPIIRPTNAPTSKPTYRGETPRPTPAPTFLIGPFPGYTLFVRGFNIFSAETSGNAVLDSEYLSNIEMWSPEGAVCVYSSLEFESGFSSYAQYSKSDSESMTVSFKVAESGGAGSLSRERTETKQYAASGQTYIYTMNLECVSSQASLTSFDELFWSTNFIKNLQSLPTSLPTTLSMNDTDIMNDFIDFWDAFGTHVIVTAKLGGVIKGAINVEKCKVEKFYSDSTSYTACLNAEYRGVEVEGCYGSSDASANSYSASNAVTNTRILVRGGDNSEFTNIFNSFGNKQNDFQNWISDLGGYPDIVSGNLNEIHTVIQKTIAFGNHKLNNKTSAVSDDQWLNIANALEAAYDVYYTYLGRNDAMFSDLECAIDCNEGLLESDECICTQCGSVTQCCDDITDAVRSHRLEMLYLLPIFFAFV